MARAAAAEGMLIAHGKRRDACRAVQTMSLPACAIAIRTTALYLLQMVFR